MKSSLKIGLCLSGGLLFLGLADWMAEHGARLLDLLF